jgi:hypothetical protein
MERDQGWIMLRESGVVEDEADGDDEGWVEWRKGIGECEEGWGGEGLGERGRREGAVIEDGGEG